MIMQVKSPYVSIYERLLNAAVDRCCDRPRLSVEQNIRYVIEGYVLFGSYWATRNRNDKREFAEAVQSRLDKQL